MQTGDSVWVELAAKRRPAVVIDVRPALVRVVHGTTQVRAYPALVVHPSSCAGRAWPLSEPTHFYGSNAHWVERHVLVRARRPVAAEVVVQLRELVGDYDATIEPR